MTVQPITSEPTKEDKKRISFDVNEQFHIELHKKTRDDKTTVAEVVRGLLEMYLSGQYKVAKQ